MNKSEFSPFSQITAMIFPDLILKRIVKTRQAEAPVFFLDPVEAINLLVLSASDFALGLEENWSLGFNLAGAAYDCLRL